MTIKEYWNLIGWEPFLAITWEPDFSQACCFCRMLINHKDFHFTQISDKNNDMFLKSPKTMFLGHFWSFMPDGDFFQKNPALSHTAVYGSLTPCYVSEKTNQPIPRKLTDRRMDRLKEGQTLFTGPFRPRPGVQ